MKQKMRIAIITSLVILFGLNEVFSKSDTEKILYNNTFEINDNALLSVVHEVGDVICSNWDKDEISVKITASVSTSTQEKAEKAFSRIQYDVVGKRDAVDVVCKVKSMKNGSKNSNLQVQLEIYMPKSVRLDLQHKFGNAYVEEVKGQSAINSSYGSIQVEAIKHPESKFKLSFGDGSMDYFAGNSINISYSSFECDEAGDISLKASYSDVNFDEAGVMSMTQEGGSLIIDEIKVLKGTSKFSSLDIDQVSEVLEIESSYGSLDVDYMPATFSEIVIDNSYGSANIGIDEGATYKLDAVAVHCEIDYPEELANFSEKIKAISKTTLIGTIGNGSSANARVSVKSSYGGTSLEAK